MADARPPVYRCKQRVFLNRVGHQGDRSSIVALVENTSRKKLERNKEGVPINWKLPPDVELVFTDCDRSVSYTFLFGRASSRQNNIVKINRMIGALMRMRAALVVETELLEKRMAENNIDDWEE